MKNSIIIATLATSLLSTSLLAAEQEQRQEHDINYGDPTAAYSTVGVSRAADSMMLNLQVNKGNNIYQVDYGFNDKALGDDKGREGNQNYRARMFHVTDEGFGVSATLLGSHNADKSGSDTALVGALYRYEVSDNVMIFPMLDVGRQFSYSTSDNGAKTREESTIVQPGVFLLYAFDDGHWLSANPRVQYNARHNDWVASAEIGGGYMINDQFSVGFRIDHNEGTDRVKEDTKFMLQANYYF
ncbi:hypothetical protein [Agarivorans sp. JK6]|uniref:hypothetical protein n=1 Tax=Agarivorans sp. JK6 TaxID=2997426 RepID=UPI003872FC93